MGAGPTWFPAPVREAWDRGVAALLEASLLPGWMAPACTAFAALLIASLWWRDTRRRPVGVQGLLLLVAAAVGGGSWFGVNRVWMPVADGVGAFVFLWVGLLTLFVLQVVAGPWRPRAVRRALRVLAAALAMTLAASLAVNAYYATYRSVGIMLGTNVHTVTWAEADVAPRAATVPVGQWRPTPDVPDAGQLTAVSLPASDPDFHPRDAVVYLPPAYRAAQRPAVPVLVLMAGVPGSPVDWAGPGDLAATMDAFAREHRGLAPVVVVVDPLGGDSLTNPLCSDGAAGKAATYVQDDVPAWIERTLQVDSDRAHWTIGGLSNGGTCALQAVTRDPHAFGQFLAMSSEPHPTLGTEERTVAEVFGGDREAFLRNDPPTLLARAEHAGDGRYRGIAGIFSFGDGDSYVGGDVSPTLAAAARAAGMDVQVRTYPGGHTWSVWSRAIADQLPWVAGRSGLPQA